MLWSVSLLVLLHGSTAIRIIEGGFYKWHDWLPRVPSLAAAVKSGDKVSVWSALKKRYWMEFINWEQQPEGFTCYDGSPFNLIHNQDGRYSEHIAEEYKHWLAPASWSGHWTTDYLVDLNARFRGAATTYYDDMLETSKCYNQDMRATCSALAYAAGDPELPFVRSYPDRRKALDRVLRVYHEEVAERTRKADDKAGPQQRKATDNLRLILEPLARLYTKLAVLHPFPDANSRIRYFVLQTEFVRFGGHPVMVRDIGDAIYRMTLVDEVEHFILEGWCAWEWALETGKYPRSALGGFVDNQGNCQQPAAVLASLEDLKQPDEPSVPIHVTDAEFDEFVAHYKGVSYA